MLNVLIQAGVIVLHMRKISINSTKIKCIEAIECAEMRSNVHRGNFSAKA